MNKNNKDPFKKFADVLRHCATAHVTVTTVAVTTGGVSLQICKNIIFLFWYSTLRSTDVAIFSTCRYSYIRWRGDSGSIVTWGVGIYQMSELARYLLAHSFTSTAVSKLSYSNVLTRIHEFLGGTLHVKKDFTFLRPKRCNKCFQIYSTRLAF